MSGLRASLPETALDRAARRHKIFEPVRLIVAGREMRAHFLNVSATGALVHAADGPAAGEGCTVLLAGREIGARVVWADGRRFGIAFRGVLRPKELARLLG